MFNLVHSNSGGFPFVKLRGNGLRVAGNKQVAEGSKTLLRLVQPTKQVRVEPRGSAIGRTTSAQLGSPMCNSSVYACKRLGEVWRGLGKSPLRQQRHSQGH